MAVIALCGSFLVGCSSDGADANYSKEIKLTDEQKAKAADEAKNHPAPGTVDPKTGIPGATPPDTMKVPGKSR